MLSFTKNVLAIFAHPDDAELLCYGLLKKLASTGVSISILIVSNGSQGVAVGDSAHSTLSLVRMKETRAALRGITENVETLSFPDGNLCVDGKTISAIEEAVLRIRPDFVITHHCDHTGIDHHDHRAVATMVRNICFRTSFIKILLSCEPLQPLANFSPSFFVDTTPYFNDKCLALASHVSQHGRAYLSEAFHRTRAARWAGLAPKTDEGPPSAVYEAFCVEKMLVE
jgi:LmbE family N-acetylglucosaminyl deacetylase